MDKTKIAVDIFNKHAIGYQNKFMDVSLYGDSLDAFCDSIQTEHANILELACGPGNITKYLLNKRLDFKILGIDLAPNMIELAKSNNPTAQFQIMDCRDIDKMEKKYDGIMCAFCLPYLSKEDAIKLINDAAKMLKPKGLLYLSTMEDDYTKSGFEKGSAGDEMYIHYHEAGYLTKALDDNNFETVYWTRMSSPPQATKKTTDLIIVAKIKS